MKVVKYYQVFNMAYRNEEMAKWNLRGWEHKEKIIEIYALIEGEEVPDIINVDSDGYYTDRIEANVVEEMEYLLNEM